jgi:hypothetical protein
MAGDGLTIAPMQPYIDEKARDGIPIPKLPVRFNDGVEMKSHERAGSSIDGALAFFGEFLLDRCSQAYQQAIHDKPIEIRSGVRSGPRNDGRIGIRTE